MANATERLQRLPMQLPIVRVKQLNQCGCGLAALEMVLRYYGAEVSQLDFLDSDRRLRGLVERSSAKGLREVTLALLALKRGFQVTLYGHSIHVNEIFLQLGGRVVHMQTSKELIRELLMRGVPPIVMLPAVDEAYGELDERAPHYVVVKGANPDGSFEVADPWYEVPIRPGYWDHWHNNIIAIERKM